MLLVLALMASARLEAADVYVATSGDDTNDCLSPAFACATIQHALDTGNPSGDVIHVGPGIFAENVIVDKPVTIQGAAMNDTTVDGAAIGSVFELGQNADVTLSDLTITNGVGGYGGGIENRGVVSLVRCRVTRNASCTGCGGGGIDNAYGTVSLTDCEVSDNTARNGAGFYNQGTLTLDRCLVTRNRAVEYNGGIESLRGVLTITDSTISDNSSNFGGGIGVLGATVLLTRTTVSGNTADCSGGGILSGFFDVDTTSVILVNSTITDNRAGCNGGGIYVGEASATVTLNSSTVSGNDARSGGGVANIRGLLQVRGSLIADNTSSQSGPDCYRELTSEGHNLLGDSSGCTVLGDPTGNLLDLPALVGPLAENGGDTPTVALLTASPAIDAGDPAGCRDSSGAPLLTDQRGVARPNGPTCDIGAFEYDCPSDTTPSDQGNVLRAIHSGDDVVLDFTGAPATAWRVFRDVDKLTIGSTALTPDVGSARYIDAAAIPVAAGPELYYNLRGLSPCTLTPGP